MSTIGMVVLSALLGMYLLGMLLGLGILIWLALKLRSDLQASKQEKDSVYAETKQVLAANQAEIKAILESGKSVFTSVRADTKALLEEHRKQTKAQLEEHRKGMQAGIDRINAEALSGAAARTIQACQRLEKIATLLQQLILETETRATNDYMDEAFAPEKTLAGTPPSGFNVSQTAALDAEVDQVQTQQLPFEMETA